MDDFTNEEVATVVSYSITFENCDEALRRFKTKFTKDGPQSSSDIMKVASTISRDAVR